MAEERLTQRGNCAPAGGPPAATSGAMQEPHASDNNMGKPSEDRSAPSPQALGSKDENASAGKKAVQGGEKTSAPPPSVTTTADGSEKSAAEENLKKKAPHTESPEEEPTDEVTLCKLGNELAKEPTLEALDRLIYFASDEARRLASAHPIHALLLGLSALRRVLKAQLQARAGSEAFKDELREVFKSSVSETLSLLESFPSFTAFPLRAEAEQLLKETSSVGHGNGCSSTEDEVGRPLQDFSKADVVHEQQILHITEGRKKLDDYRNRVRVLRAAVTAQVTNWRNRGQELEDAEKEAALMLRASHAANEEKLPRVRAAEEEPVNEGEAFTAQPAQVDSLLRCVTHHWEVAEEIVRLRAKQADARAVHAILVVWASSVDRLTDDLCSKAEGAHAVVTKPDLVLAKKLAAQYEGLAKDLLAGKKRRLDALQRKVSGTQGAEEGQERPLKRGGVKPCLLM